MSVPTFHKRPGAERVFTIKWANVLPDDVTISTASWQVPDALTIIATSKTTTDTLVKLGGGVLGDLHPVLCQVVLSNGEKDERTFYVGIVL